MDATSIAIIVVTTITAIAFKWFLFRRIRRWMDADLIKGLAGDNQALLVHLQQQLADLQAAGTPRSQIHEKLEQMAAGFEPAPSKQPASEQNV
ncbi:MAG: DUF3352 domain-containing protein [Marinobacterium sp.]|nr:DUF3352 domain-containing protein [Marinobacterium sp.]